jgi:ketosteroid isomerase-like protein
LRARRFRLTIVAQLEGRPMPRPLPTVAACAALGVTLLAGPAMAGGRCASSPADQSAVAEAVRAWFKAAAADDEAGVLAVQAPEFYAFDAGERFEGRVLFDLVKQAHAAGVVIEWNLGPIKAETHCDLAWASWENHGRAGKGDQLQPISWQESAVFRRDKGRWRMVFLHSNRAEKPKG